MSNQVSSSTTGAVPETWLTRDSPGNLIRSEVPVPDGSGGSQLAPITRYDYDDSSIKGASTTVIPGKVSASRTWDDLGLATVYANRNGRTVTYATDPATRTTTETLSDGRTIFGTSNAAGQVASVVDTFGNEVTRIEYDYNADNLRIEKRISDDEGVTWPSIERYALDGDDVVLVFDETGSVEHTYFHGPAVDQIFADADATGEILWALGDHQGTVRDWITAADANANGTPTQHVLYSAFGEIVSATDPSTLPAYAYTGREWDADAGLYYYRNRWYDPVIGRFVSDDPIGFAAGDTNLARYVGNSAPNSIDSNGLQSRTSPNKTTMSESRNSQTVLHHNVTPMYPSWDIFPGSEVSSLSTAFKQRFLNGTRPQGAFLVWERWSQKQQVAFVNEFVSDLAWRTAVHEAAARYSLPEDLLWGSLIRQLLDFAWEDYNEFGDTRGPGQLSFATVSAYALEPQRQDFSRGLDRELRLHPNAYWKSQRFRASVHALSQHTRVSIDLTSQRIAKQILELHTSLNGGGTVQWSWLGEEPRAIPALTDIPPLNHRFRIWPKHAPYT